MEKMTRKNRSRKSFIDALLNMLERSFTSKNDLMVSPIMPAELEMEYINRKKRMNKITNTQFSVCGSEGWRIPKKPVGMAFIESAIAFSESVAAWIESILASE